MIWNYLANIIQGQKGFKTMMLEQKQAVSK